MAIMPVLQLISHASQTTYIKTPVGLHTFQDSYAETTRYQILYSQQMMLWPGLVCSKLSLLFLFLQLFDVRGGMKIAIRIGFVATFVTYVPALPIESYFNAPSVGQSWEALMLSGKPNKAIYWGIVQSVLGILLDMYLFVLPLPVISQLQIASRKRLQLMLIFSTAFM